MSETAPARATYRHGNVREEAIAAAYELAVSGGPEALSLRRIAEKIGVTHRSLYNHFADRDALIDAVAEVGYTKLGARLKKADDADGFVRIYVSFALKQPTLYGLMRSRPHATMKERPALQRAAHIGITEALRVFGRKGASSAENRRAVMKVLILLHGGISMHLNGILDVPGDEGLISEMQKMVASG